ncbi:hypothetical protein GGR51DRAFT_517045 [Nemania sp. FL0031]|nr:hypothetical protein GGR51DRAFT_517045 [Nemania sp. FL0031]
MSEYVNNYNFDAFMAPNEETIDLGFFNDAAFIGQNGPAAYGHDAGYGLDLDIGGGFSAPMALNEEILNPSLLNNTTLLGQNEHAIHQSNTTYDFNFEFNANFQLKPSLPAPPDATATIHQYLFFSQEDLRDHELIPHTPTHHPVWNDSAIRCAECNETFDNSKKLRVHAQHRTHSPYFCSCEVNFARNDALRRHIASYLKENAKYPCTFCRRHRGKQAFRRKDHLVQHLQGYHKMEHEELSKTSPPRIRVPNVTYDIYICAHVGCEAYRDDDFRSLPWLDQIKERPFKKRSDYNKHMRDVHKESTFPCRITGCDRVGIKGYTREKDLMKHIKNKHPEAPQYVPSQPPRH